MELWRRGSSTWHEEGRWEWGQCIRILKDRASRRAERQTHVQLQDGLIFCFIFRCCVGVQASSLVTVLLGGKGDARTTPSLALFSPDSDSELLIKAIEGELNLIIFTKEYCTALYAALYTRYLWAYVFGIVSSQQQHVGSTCLSSFCVGFACSSCYYVYVLYRYCSFLSQFRNMYTCALTRCSCWVTLTVGRFFIMRQSLHLTTNGMCQTEVDVPHEYSFKVSFWIKLIL